MKKHPRQKQLDVKKLIEEISKKLSKDSSNLERILEASQGSRKLKLNRHQVLVDGVLLKKGHGFLLKNQLDPKRNGLYVIADR